MSLTVLNRKFLAVLLDLGIDLSQFPDKTFDGLFETNCNDSKDFLEWFCEYVSKDNILTDEERAAYDELENTKYVPVGSLEKSLYDCHPSYDDVMDLDSDCVNLLTDELESLNKECHDLLDIRSSLDLQYDKIRKIQNNVLEESHKQKNNLEDVKRLCEDVNINVKDSLKDISFLLLKSPGMFMDFNLFTDGVKFEKESFDVSGAIDRNFSLFDGNQRNPYKSLKENLAVVEHWKITSLGRLEEKKFVFSNLDKVVKSRKSEDGQKVMDLYFVPKEANTSRKLAEDILLFEEKEIPSLTEKLSNLEISQLLSHFYFDKLYSVNNLISKGSYYKESAEIIEAFNLILLHILRRSVKNVNNVDKLICNFSAGLNKNYSSESDRIDFANRRIKRYDEFIRTIPKNHPILLALKKIVPDIEEKRLGNLSCGMKLLLQNSDFRCQPLYDEIKYQIRMYLGMVLCGPTRQLQFTEIEIQKKFQRCEYFLTQRKNDIKKLANKYLALKNAVSQGNRTKSLLWTLFLTNPEKLESIIRSMEKETFSLDLKYSNGETTLY